MLLDDMESPEAVDASLEENRVHGQIKEGLRDITRRVMQVPHP